jgi:hypothetical protein
MVLPLTYSEVLPSYQAVQPGAITLTQPSIIIAMEDLPSADETELDDEVGNPPELVRAILRQFYKAVNARPEADRPTKFVILRQQDISTSGVSVEPLQSEGSITYSITAFFPVDSDDSVISAEPED